MVNWFWMFVTKWNGTGVDRSILGTKSVVAGVLLGLALLTAGCGLQPAVVAAPNSPNPPNTAPVAL